MRVDLNGSIRDASLVSDAAEKSSTRAAASAVSSGAGAADKADLSLDQGRVQALAAEVNNLPEVRQEKVAALSRVISQGKYQVTPQQTAEALFAEMQARSAA